MIYAYIRVSTDKQTVENQRFEINRFAKQRDFQIDVWVEETVSGTRSAKDRKLGVLLNKERQSNLYYQRRKVSPDLIEVF